jgi:hypothetical protein
MEYYIEFRRAFMMCEIQSMDMYSITILNGHSDGCMGREDDRWPDPCISLKGLAIYLISPGVTVT